MPAPKRYFHFSQEINSDPEGWEFTAKFGDRALRTLIQLLVILDRLGNEWRLCGDWLGTLSRMVRQSAANVSRQIDWMITNGWLRVRETAADGSPLVLEAPNWWKYNRRQERKENDQSTAQRSDKDPLLSSPTPPPNLPLPTPKIKKEEKIKTSVSVVSTERPLKEVTIGKTSKTWDAYASAYQTRYGATPVRNAKVNGILARLVDRLGEDESPKVAAFYLTHNKPFYVTARHPTDLLLRDAEGLRTEWATGVKATTGEVRNVEQLDSMRAQVERVRAQMQGGR